MIRYDIYDKQLNPNDFICWVSRCELFAGQIQSISVKGTIRVRPWNDAIGLYSVITQQVKSYRIIKTAGL